MGSADFWQFVISAAVGLVGALGAVALGAWMNDRAQTRARREERERRDEELREQRAHDARAELRAEARELAAHIGTLQSEMDGYTRRPSAETAERLLSEWQEIETEIDFFVAGHYTPTTKEAADFAKQELLIAAHMIDDHRAAVRAEAAGEPRETWRADERLGDLREQLVMVFGQVKVFLEHLFRVISSTEDDENDEDDEDDYPSSGS